MNDKHRQSGDPPRRSLALSRAFRRTGAFLRIPGLALVLLSLASLRAWGGATEIPSLELGVSYSGQPDHAKEVVLSVKNTGVRPFRINYIIPDAKGFFLRLKDPETSKEVFTAGLRASLVTAYSSLTDARLAAGERMEVPFKFGTLKAGAAYLLDCEWAATPDAPAIVVTDLRLETDSLGRISKIEVTPKTAVSHVLVKMLREQQNYKPVPRKPGDVDIFAEKISAPVSPP